MTTLEYTYKKDAELVLFEGDCLKLLKQIPDNSIMLIVTSPPYNLGKEYETKKPLKKYLEDFNPIITELVRVLHTSGSICWQVGNFVSSGEVHPLDIPFYHLFKKHKLKLRNRIVWNYRTGLTCHKRFSGRYETILWFTKGKDYLFNHDAVKVPYLYKSKHNSPIGRSPTDVWLLPKTIIENTGHPCPYPVALIERLVLAFTNPGDRVLDPFLGSGTTAIASLIHKRKFIGAENYPKYINIIKNRIKRLKNGVLRYRSLYDQTWGEHSKVA